MYHATDKKRKCLLVEKLKIVCKKTCFLNIYTYLHFKKINTSVCCHCGSVISRSSLYIKCRLLFLCFLPPMQREQFGTLQDCLRGRTWCCFRIFQTLYNLFACLIYRNSRFYYIVIHKLRVKIYVGVKSFTFHFRDVDIVVYGV